MQSYRVQTDSGRHAAALAIHAQDSDLPWPRRQGEAFRGSTIGAETETAGRQTAYEGPERPRFRRRPPFAWQLAADYEREFRVSGDWKEVVTKVRDFRDRDWVVPVGSSLRLSRGGAYRWTLRIERKCAYRPQLQLGIHGAGHRRPWRLLTTSRCSRARDDEPWLDRPGGDKAIEEGDFVHVELDLRGLHLPFGTLSVAVNTEPAEIVFDDIPLSSSTLIMPVVSMGGDQARIRLCPAY